MVSAVTPRWLDRLVIATFLVALVAPSVDLFVRPRTARGPELYELRYSAPMPELDATLASFTAFPERFNAYFDDHFGLRDKLIRGHSIVYLFGVEVSPRRDLTLGGDGWLFYSGGRTLDNSRGALPLSEDELEGWRFAIQAQRDAVARLGADFLFVIAPNKETIYPHLMPRGRNFVGPSRYDQVLERLRTKSDVPVLDLRPALRAEAALDTPGDYTYYPHGSHWYGRGAYRAYAEIVTKLAETYPGLAPLSTAEVVPFEGVPDSWGINAYIPDLLPIYSRCFRPAAPRARFSGTRDWGVAHDLTSEIDDPKLPRVFVFEDSMGAYVEELLAEHCSYFGTRWSNDLDLADVRKHRPDVVISIHIERVFQGAFTRLVRGDVAPELAFERATREVFTFDPAGPLDAFRVEGSPRVERVADQRGSAVAIELASRDDNVILPHFDPPADGHVFVELVLESAVQQSAAVWFKRAEAPHYARAGRVARSLEIGSNRIVFELAVPRLSGDLRLRVGAVHGHCVLRSFRVRAP